MSCFGRGAVGGDCLTNEWPQAVSVRGKSERYSVLEERGRVSSMLDGRDMEERIIE